MAKPSDTGEPGGSRPGTLDDGFNLVAKDLDRAFCLGLSTNQAVIMNGVREQSWTASLLARRKGEPRPQPVPAKLNLTHLAADSGLHRSRLSLALKALIAAGVLAYVEGGYLIKKDYSRWLDDDGKAPRFTPAQLRFIRAAKAPKKGLQIADIDTPLPLQSATPSAEMNGQIQTQLPLQSATVNDCLPLPIVTATVTDCNSSRYKAQQRDTVLERAAEDSLDFKIDTHIPPEPPIGESAPNLRTRDDLADVTDAIRFLGAHPSTEHLAQLLGQMHNTRSDIGIQGWRWVVASRRIAERRRVARLGFPYLRKIATNATMDELAEIRAEESPADLGQPGSRAGPAPGRKPTQAERRKAENEAWRLVGEQLKSEED